MHRGMLLATGFLELIVASALIIVGCHLPERQTLEQSFDRVAVIAESAEKQVELMHGQVEDVRQRDFPQVVRQMRQHSQTISTNLQSAKIDFATVEAMSQALGATAKGLNDWSSLFDSKRSAQAVNRLGQLADSIERQGLIGSPSYNRDHRQLIKWFDWPSVAGLDEEWPSTPRDDPKERVKFKRDLTDPGIVAMRSGFLELEQSLGRVIEQLDILSNARLPVFTSTGLEMRPLWPDGAATVESLRKARMAALQINRDLERIASQLPAMLQSTERIHGKFHETADAAAEHWRQTVVSLRQSQDQMARTIDTWPQLVATMRNSAIVLDGSRRQLDSVLAQREQYDRAVRGSQSLTRSAEEMLEASTLKLDTQLAEQSQSLSQMENGLTEVSRALPTVKQSMCDLLTALRWALWVVGGLIGVHGAFLLGATHARGLRSTLARDA